jgi:hypothetical protein
MCWLRSLSHLQIFITTLNLGMLMAVFLKVYGIDNIKAILASMTILTIGMFILGHYDIKYKWMQTETSLANEQNPEIQSIKKKVKG